MPHSCPAAFPFSSPGGTWCLWVADCSLSSRPSSTKHDAFGRHVCNNHGKMEWQNYAAPLGLEGLTSCTAAAGSYTWSYLACRIGRLVPIWQALLPLFAVLLRELHK
jgi:hypothetical protein